MRVEPLVRQGYRLLHEGARELAVVEANGIRIDVEGLQRMKLQLGEKIRALRVEVERSSLWKVWRKRHGAKANMTSRDQLAGVLHGDLGFEVTKVTESGRPAMDEEALQRIDHPDAARLIRLAKYEKAQGTYLKGIEKEIVGDRIHPVFNLHTARTYRSSCDSPNFQNMPVRDKEVAEIIRSQIIASPKSVLMENDFKGIEVSVSACYHKDPRFIQYITTPGKDMHRDMAAQIYCLRPDEVSKDARYGAKNKFVFPQFYGDFYVSCARSLWEWIEKGKLKGPDGKGLKRHLRSQGIVECGACDPEQRPTEGSFEKHLKEVEDDFWNRRFMRYGEWRKMWYQSYLKRGYFDLLSGFRVYGSFARNAVVNYPVQGAAFHCLLWCLIEIGRRLRKYKMRSMIVGQIHDSLIGDVREKELRDYLEIVERVTTVDLRRHFEWLVVPLEIEYEVSPPGKSWFAKQEMKFSKGAFLLPGREPITDPRVFLREIGN